MIKPEYSKTADGRQLDTTTITDSYIKAVNVNRSIVANAQVAQISLYEVCKGLKEMRDDKLYKELGYQNFEEYCEKETGIKYRQAYNFIKIIEVYGENLQPVADLGTTKLALLASLSEEERTEITENTDLESVSKRELESKIAEIRSLQARLDDTGNALRSTANEKTCLEKELDEISRERDRLYQQINEFENRPIDVTVCESESREIENLKKAMKICDDQWAEKYNELQENTIIHTRELHQDYKAKMEQLTADYEKKLAEIQESSETVSEKETVPDMKETFKAYYSIAYNAFNTMMGFVKSQCDEDRKFCLEKSEKLINVLKKSIQEV